MIERKLASDAIKHLLKTFPVVALLGARQCGKTTLAKQIPHAHFFDLENPSDLSQLDDPKLALESLKGLIIIDEIQQKPNLFPLLRYLVDSQHAQRYLILGSASRDLIRQSAETLAGRISYYHLHGFHLREVGINHQKALWMRGGFPRSFLAPTEEESLQWREAYITTFLERDIPQLGIRIPAQTLRRFWTMLSHYHGQLLNASEIGRSFGISDMTVRKYIDILAGTFMVRVLYPWHTNIGKRLVKSQKIYISDSGLFHALQSIEDEHQLLAHPKLGASWEGFALEMIAQTLGYEDERLFFWKTHGGTELDLFWQQKGKNWGVELKYASAPRMSKSMHSALHDLQLAHLWIVIPEGESSLLRKNVTVIPLSQVAEVSG